MHEKRLGTTSEAEGQRLFGRDFVLLSLATWCMLLSLSLLISTLPLYVSSVGGQGVEIGLVVGAASLAAMMGRIIAGTAVDRWGGKALLIGGAASLTIAAFAYNFAVSVPSLLILRIIHGLSFAVSTTAASALVVFVVPARRRGEAIGYFGLVFNLSIAVGPVIGLALVGLPSPVLQGFPLLFAVAGSMAALGTMQGLLVREASRPKRPSGAPGIGLADFVVPAALPPAVAGLLATVSYGGITAFLPLYVAQVDAQNAGIFFFVYASVVMLTRPIVGKASDRLGRRPVIIPAMLLGALGVGLLALSPSLPTLIPAAIIYGLGFGAVYPTLLALVIDLVPAERRGTAIGTNGAAFDSGTALGAILLGLVAQAAGYRLAFLSAAGCLLLGLVFFVSCAHLFDPRPSVRESAEGAAGKGETAGH